MSRLAVVTLVALLGCERASVETEHVKHATKEKLETREHIKRLRTPRDERAHAEARLRELERELEARIAEIDAAIKQVERAKSDADKTAP